MKTLNMSKRAFRIVGFENGSSIDASFTIQEILNKDNNDELFFSLQEMIDEILDLGPGESCIGRSSRDCTPKSSHIIIYRIS